MAPLADIRPSARNLALLNIAIGKLDALAHYSGTALH
jgi:hypothetical protein